MARRKLSESVSLGRILRKVDEAQDAIGILYSRDYSRLSAFQRQQLSLVVERLKEVVEIAFDLGEQAKRGVHRNPPLVIFGNPPEQARQFGTDVLALLYRHKKDGEFYCHGFGNADIELEGSPFEGVTIHRLKERTGVKLFAMPDGTVLLSKPGTDLWEDIEP